MVQLFISAVTNEFGSYRQALAADLNRPGVHVETQEAFIAHGLATLLMLDDYIARCDAVVHIAGDQTGSAVDQASFTALVDKHPDLLQTLQLDESTARDITYTQWEALLAVFHRKRLFIPTPTLEAPRDNAPEDDERDRQRASQKAHLAHLRRLGIYGEDSLRFTNPDRLVIALLRSKLYDLLPTAAAQHHAVVFKGMRSFDAGDREFFLELLPGPRDRNGLPESIRFWKHRIEGKECFGVGVMFGPSGCGKSSLVKAGLLPRLSGHVAGFLVEASAANTEERLLVALRKQFPVLPPHLDLVGAIAALAEGQGLSKGRKKAFLVIDQFEQWLHANGSQTNTILAQALRRCDGEHVQCLLLVRDDFWTALERFLEQLPVEMHPDRNVARVDLFDTLHARRVLEAFGRAFGRLGQELTPENEQFLEQAVRELTQDGRVISIRLAVFADMVKGKPWTPATWKAMGGMEGVGMTFLEETFYGGTATPRARTYSTAAKATLKELLPPPGTLIKGGMKSYDHLLQKSGYAGNPREFDEVLKLLTSELRLVTPTEAGSAEAGGRYYQLTHDYLVHSLEQWLRRKQGETPRGRAELRLALCAAAWDAKHDRRLLPTLWEWMSIWHLTKRRFWTEPEQRMMRAANRLHAMRAGLLAGFLVLATLAGLFAWHLIQRERQSLLVAGLVQQLLDADSPQVPEIVANLHPHRRDAEPLLRKAYADAERAEATAASAAERTRWARQRLLASLALAEDDDQQMPFLLDRLLEAGPRDFPVIRDTLERRRGDLVKKLWAVVESPPARGEGQRLRAGCALAAYDGENAQWAEAAAPVVKQLLAVGPDSLGLWMEALRPARGKLIGPLEAVFRAPADDRTSAYIAAGILADFASEQPDRLIDLMLDADARQFGVLAPKLKSDPDRVINRLEAELAKQAAPEASDTEKDRLAKRHANAAAMLLKMNRPMQVWPLLAHRPDGRERAYLINRLASLGTEPSVLTGRLFAEAHARTGAAQENRASPVERLLFDPEKSAARALILSLGEFGPGQLTPMERKALVPRLLKLYRDDPDPGLHGACDWLLRAWKEEEALAEIDRELAAGKVEGRRGWYITRQGQTLVLVPGPSSFEMGSPPGETGREGGPTGMTERPKLKTIRRTFAIASREVTVKQFLQFNDKHVYDQAFAPTPDCPVTSVRWYEAAAYCNWLSEKENIPREQWCYLPNAEGKYAEGMKTTPNYLERLGYRLPTEAEWELACRAGSRGSRYYGESTELLDRYAWYTRNSLDRWMLPVGTLRPNDLGLFDMLGNAMEWTMGEVVNSSALAEEQSGDDMESPRDAIRITDTARVSRGGSFLSYTLNVRAAFRNWIKPSFASKVIGFRVARTMR